MKNDLGATPQRSGEAGSIDTSSATARHTPGPWRFERSGYSATIYAQCVPIANAWNGDGYDWIPGERFLYPENAKANAHLIAAAPELLELAYSVAEHFRDTDAPLGAAARAAIAKAEGKD